jgi:lipopolysaccharide biosynthesis protein
MKLLRYDKSVPGRKTKKLLRRINIYFSQVSQIPSDFLPYFSIFNVKRLSRHKKEIPLQVLVVIHAYWPQEFKLIIRYLNKIEMPLSVLVTIPLGENALEVKKLLFTISKHHNINSMSVGNEGRDVKPFLTAIGSLESHCWDFVIKLHTKASQSVWFESLVRSLLKSDSRIQNHARLLKKYPKRIIVHPLFRYPGHKQRSSEPAMKYLKAQLTRSNFRIPKKWYFPAGTMFAGTTELLVALREEGELLIPIEFQTEENYSQGSTAHMYERFIGLYALTKGEGLLCTSMSDYFDLKALKTKMI